MHCAHTIVKKKNQTKIVNYLRLCRLLSIIPPMENLLKLAMDRRGLTPIEASRLGVPYHRIFKQYKGERRVSLRSALLYEKVLGIPVTELLPESSPSHTDPPEELEARAQDAPVS